MMIDESDLHGPSAWATSLGFAGLIPFVALSAALWLPELVSQSFVSHALSTYALAIISFLGAIHWGLLMRDMPSSSMSSFGWIWGVTPSLLAWVVNFFAYPVELILMALLLWLCYMVDRRRYPKFKLSAWLPLRLRLTVVASAACLVGSAGFYLNQSIM
jgi:hypothetical protein